MPSDNNKSGFFEAQICATWKQILTSGTINRLSIQAIALTPEGALSSAQILKSEIEILDAWSSSLKEDLAHINTKLELFKSKIN